jgi:flagellar motor switch protein FliN/FliY
MAEDGPLSQADIDALTAGLLGDAGGSAFDPDSLRPDVDLILEQASAVLGTLLNRHAKLAVSGMREAEAGALAQGLDEEGLIVRLAFEHGLPGELCLLVRKETAARLSGLMMGGDGNAAYKDEDSDALNEFGNQFMGALCTALGARHGATVSSKQAQTAAFVPENPPFDLSGAALIDADLTLEGAPEALFRLLLSSDLAAKLGGASSSPAAEENPLASLGGFDTSLARSMEESPPNIQMLLDINLNVSIELGRTRLSIRKILELGPGSIIELDRLAGEPVDLLVNDKVVAKGEVVVVDEYFGIRIISLVSPEERIKQLK